MFEFHVCDDGYSKTKIIIKADTIFDGEQNISFSVVNSFIVPIIDIIFVKA